MQRFRRFDACDTHLDGMNAFTSARDACAQYLLSLDPDRLLEPYRIECGISATGDVVPYPSWESMGMGGHIAGHYLSALAGYWAESRRAVFRDRAQYVVTGLAECQQTVGTGYLCGASHGRHLFERIAVGDIEAQPFELDGGWVPLYNLHKLFAGLVDCWVAFAADESGASAALSALSRDIVLKLADWWCSIADGIDDEAFQRMLICEFGGMNEIFARLYELTGQNRYLDQARRFTDCALFAPLSEGRDELTGLHANTQIPKVLGYERIAALAGDRRYERAVDTFWRSVTQQRSVSIGAHSVAEHFNDAGDFSSMITSRQGVETCNSYNMSKLAERLFLRTGEERYLAFYERVLENHIVSTIGPHEGGFVYFTPMRPNHYRVYSASQSSFWCCVGSGLENHARYGRLIYTTDAVGDAVALYINLFLPSTLRWRSQGIRVSQRWKPVDWNHDSGVFQMEGEPGAACTQVLYVRRPAWVEDVVYRFERGHGVVERASVDGNYDRLRLSWTGSMRVYVDCRVSVRIEGLPDGSPWGSVIRGAQVLVLRGDDIDLDGLVSDESRTGHIASGPVRRLSSTPILDGEDCLLPHDRPDGTADVRVRTRDASTGWWTCRVATMLPFPSIEGSRYSLYLPWASDKDVDAVYRGLTAIDVDEASYAGLLCDVVRCGEQQSEIDHAYSGRGDVVGRQGDRRYRCAGNDGSFSYMLRDWECIAGVIVVEILSDDVEQDYVVEFDGAVLPRASRDKRGHVDVHRYRVRRGAFGQGDDMSARVRIRAVRGKTPRVTAIGLARQEE